MNYFEKSKKGINALNLSQGAAFAQQNKERLDNAVNSSYIDGKSQYERILEKNMADILSGRNNHSFAPDEVLSQYARDYSALNKLGIASAKQSSQDYASGYGADFSGAVADQTANDYITSPELLSLAQNMQNAQILNKLNGVQNASALSEFEYAKNQDAITALQQARALEQSAYSKLANQDLQAYADRQSALQSMLKYQTNLDLDNAELAQNQREADQNYELNQLAYKKARSSGSSGSSGSSNSNSPTNYNSAVGVQATATSADGVMLIENWIKNNKGYSNAELQSALAQLYSKGYLTKTGMDSLYLKYQNQTVSKASKTGGYSKSPTTNRFADTRNGIKKGF